MTMSYALRRASSLAAGLVGVALLIFGVQLLATELGFTATGRWFLAGWWGGQSFDRMYARWKVAA